MGVEFIYPEDEKPVTDPQIENNVISSSSIIKKMKKDISYIQLKLGLFNNFFEATKELFEDTYNNMMIADMENKKVL